MPPTATLFIHLAAHSFASYHSVGKKGDNRKIPYIGIKKQHGVTLTYTQLLSKAHVTIYSPVVQVQLRQSFGQTPIRFLKL